MARGAALLRIKLLVHQVQMMVPSRPKLLRRVGWWLLLAIVVTLVTTCQRLTTDTTVRQSSASTAEVPVARSLDYQTHSVTTPMGESIVHTLLIPHGSRFQITAAIATGLDTLETFAQREGAIAVLNGGYFDPVNQQTTSYVVLNGILVANPRTNERLMGNPQLSAYLERILNRSEFRRYRCTEGDRYDIAVHADPVLAGCELVDAVGAGPQLLPQITLYAEGFTDRETGTVTRDAIGSRQPNARTAIGLTAEGDVLWVMAAQRADAPGQSGLDLSTLAQFMRSLGVVKAMNLDGGSSSALHYRGETLHGKVNASGEQVRRPVKSVFIVKEQQS